MTHVAELHHADLSQLADATVGRLRLQEELSQRHFFASEELPHVDGGCVSCKRQTACVRDFGKRGLHSTLRPAWHVSENCKGGCVGYSTYA